MRFFGDAAAGKLQGKARRLSTRCPLKTILAPRSRGRTAHTDSLNFVRREITMFRRNPTLIFAAALAPLALLVSPATWAQTTATEIRGLIRDASGGVVVGAQVSLTRTATGTVTRRTTNESGLYVFPLIEPGEYRVDVEMAGFKPHTVSGVIVQFQQRARVDVQLEVGALAERIEVVGGLRLLETEEAAVGGNIESRRIVELPLAARNIGHLAVLVPGVIFGGRMGATTGEGGASPGGTSVALVARGQHEITQKITLDGVQAQESRSNTMSLMPSLDAIEEFKVQTAAYSAEFGLGGGAQVQVAMKSGTNEFHGSVYNFARNDALDAEDYFLNFGLAPGEARRPKSRFRQQHFGAFLSGPVYLPGYDGRNRTFWSFNYEGRRRLTESTQTQWYPSEAMRRGDFSELMSPINPSTGRAVRTPILIYDFLTGEPFTGNVIPVNRLNPGAMNLLQYIPARDFTQVDPLDFTNRKPVPTTIRQNAWFIRADHNFSERDRVFARLAWDKQEQDAPEFNPHFGYTHLNDPLNLAAQWIHTFSPTMLNEFRFGIQKSVEDRVFRRDFQDFDQDALGIGIWRVALAGNRKLVGRENTIPQMTGLGFAFGDGGNTFGINYFRNTQVSDQLSIIRSNHSFKMGFEFRHDLHDYQGSNVTRGRLGFSSLESGHGFASFLLGYANMAETPEGLPLMQPRTKHWGVYFLDNWEVHRKLTLNLGLRYDGIGYPVAANGSFRTVDFERTYTTADGRKIPTIYPGAVGEAAAIPLMEPDRRFLMPRVGLAFRPADKWVVRAGGGWYANIATGFTYLALGFMPPYSGNLSFVSVQDVALRIPVTVGGQTYNITTRKIRPGSRLLELGNNLFPTESAASLSPENLVSIQPDRKGSNHWTWSLDIQRELPLETALTIGYVGSKTSNLVDSVDNFNQAEPSLDQNFQARRPYQYFHDPLRPEIPVRPLGNVRMLDSGANGFYHGMSVSLNKRYSRGLAYGVAYTFSKAHGEGSGGANDNAHFQDPKNRRSSRAPQVFDLTHVTLFNFVYELPFLKTAKGVTHAVLGGWQINGILALRSGFPITITQPNNLNTGIATRAVEFVPDRIADGRLDNATRQLWFDPSAFRRTTCLIPGRPDLCRYGNAGRGILRGPSQRNTDLSLYKNFQLPFGPEQMRLQVRFEAFNALNTPYFGNPQGIGFQSADTIVPDAPRMGEIRSLNASMRRLQLALKISW